MNYLNITPPNPNFSFFFNKITTETNHNKVMLLTIFVDTTDDTLKQIYNNSAINHNAKIVNEPHFYDAGFDLFLPKNEYNQEFCGNQISFYGTGWEDVGPINKVDFKIKCCAKMYTKYDKFYYTPFYTYARSSMSKTPLRLANNQGIIDAGYRGNLIGMFDCIYNNNNSDDREQDFYMDAYSRILQICAPGLVPIYIQIVNNIEELGPTTSRGECGIGSTGK